MALFKAWSAEAASNCTAILEFMVEDPDAEYAWLKGKVETMDEPKTMSWGNRTVQFRDPEGTIVSLFAPVTEAARKGSDRAERRCPIPALCACRR